MKKHFNKVCGAIGLVTVLASGTALAVGPWSNAVIVTGIEVDPTSTGSQTYLRFATAPTGRPACGTNVQVVFVGNPDQIKAMTSLATAAFLSGKHIQLYWDGGCTAGGYSNVQLVAIS